MKDCIFCKILAGDIPSSRVYEDDDVFAFLDIMPASKGHTLVIPKKHCAAVSDMPDNAFSALFKAVKLIEPVIVRELGAEGSNLIVNTGMCAGQVVFHAHVHIIPRSPDDELSFSWHHVSYDSKDEMKHMAASIEAHVQKQNSKDKV